MELSKKQVDKAGDALRVTPNDSHALEILSKWRGSHVYPLGLAFKLLKRHTDKVGNNAIYGQRLKRVSSIVSKLNRLPNTKLSRMQDIGGCRVILNSFDRLWVLYLSLKKNKSILPDSGKNYIFSPKDDGYRGIHLIYQCGSTDSDYNGLKIEFQLRTKLQHAWATTVEIIDSFEGEHLKLGAGSSDWREFFYLIADEFAKMEELPLHNNSIENRRDKIVQLEKKLDVLNKLRKYSTMIAVLSDKNSPKIIKKSEFYLLKLDTKEHLLDISTHNDEILAQEQYINYEQRHIGDENINVLLIKSASVKNIKKSYPNYFADTKLFCDKLSQILL